MAIMVVMMMVMAMNCHRNEDDDDSDDDDDDIGLRNAYGLSKRLQSSLRRLFSFAIVFLKSIFVLFWPISFNSIFRSPCRTRFPICHRLDVFLPDHIIRLSVGSHHNETTSNPWPLNRIATAFHSSYYHHSIRSSFSLVLGEKRKFRVPFDHVTAQWRPRGKAQITTFVVIRERWLADKWTGNHLKRGHRRLASGAPSSGRRNGVRTKISLILTNRKESSLNYLIIILYRCTWRKAVKIMSMSWRHARRWSSDGSKMTLFRIRKFIIYLLSFLALNDFL